MRPATPPIPPSAYSTPQASSAPPLSDPTSTARLSLPPLLRLPLGATLSFFTGTLLGISHGSSTTALRFRAENAHRLPTTPTGWYLYHKSKNYAMMLGGVKEGFRMGLKVGWWGGVFFVAEEAVDQLRNRWGGGKDAGSTLVAGLGVSGGFALWNRFTIHEAARTAKKGLVFGLLFGVAQDVLALARGRRVGYVDFVLGRRRDGKLDEEKTLDMPS
ncbi:MAG: hypothetical protein M1824_002505 [Vezdaea acicularis]|nr:MAG: hypothetical protein M1824_002505 [Vezdaea acicularis]